MTIYQIINLSILVVAIIWGVVMVVRGRKDYYRFKRWADAETDRCKKLHEELQKDIERLNDVRNEYMDPFKVKQRISGADLTKILDRSKQ